MTEVIYGVRTELKKEMPEWGRSAEWLFENKYGEKWIGTLDDGTLLVAGSDLDWTELRLNKKHAEEILEIVIEGKTPSSDFIHNPLSKWILGQDELFWIISIIKASKERLTF